MRLSFPRASRSRPRSSFEISSGFLSPLAPLFLTAPTRERLRPTEWGAEEEDAEDVKQWEEDWDDTDANDDFTRQLRAELERHQ